jgi:hypothetical protein
MNKTTAYALTAGALIAGAAVLPRASAQESTQQPGQPTRANVWIQNRGEMEAVPVAIEGVTSESPLRVAIVGVPRISMDPASTLQARAVRQSWEYRTVSLAAGQDPVAALNAAGVDGWETAGVTLSTGSSTVILLKRPV